MTRAEVEANPEKFLAIREHGGYAETLAKLHEDCHNFKVFGFKVIDYDKKKIEKEFYNSLKSYDEDINVFKLDKALKLPKQPDYDEHGHNDDYRPVKKYYKKYPQLNGVNYHDAHRDAMDDMFDVVYDMQKKTVLKALKSIKGLMDRDGGYLPDKVQKWITKYMGAGTNMNEILRNVINKNKIEIPYGAKTFLLHIDREVILDATGEPYIVGSNLYDDYIMDNQQIVFKFGTDVENKKVKKALANLKIFDVEPIKNLVNGAANVKREYMIGDDMYPHGTSEIFGAYGSLKTYVMLEQALCVAHGVAYRGKEVKQGKVIYLVTEAPEEFMVRIGSVAKALGISKVDEEMFMVLSNDNIKLNLSNDSTISKLTAVSKIMKGKNNEKLSWLIIDTLIHAAPEFNTSDSVGNGWGLVANNITTLRQFFNVVTWVAHTPKGNNKTYSGSPNRMNSLDFAINIFKTKKTDTFCTLNCAKNKGGEEWQNFKVTFESHVDDNSNKTLVPKL